MIIDLQIYSFNFIQQTKAAALFSLKKQLTNSNKTKVKQLIMEIKFNELRTIINFNSSFIYA